MNRISEFSSRADGLAKRPREVFTSKQRLMHGSEISREVWEIHSENVAKPAEKKQRRSFNDAIKMLALTAMKEAYDGKTSEEVLELMTEPLDNYLFEVKRAEDGTEWKNIHYETMNTPEQFTITQGKVDIIMPECCTVVDSSGTEYPHTGTQIDLLKGTVKEV